MKPARGSGRKSSHVPESRRRRGPIKKNLPTTSQETDHSSEGGRQAEVKKRKRPSPSAELTREKWKPLAQPVIVALDKMLGLSVLSVLSMKLKEKEETQKHLNILKERFLASCVQLTVPPRKQVDLGQESRQYQTENLKAKEGEKRLKSLEENHRSVLSALEELEVTRDRLAEECRILKFKVEELEETSQEILQRKERTVLHLPPLPPRSEVDQPLQEQLMKLLPKGADLVKTMQNMTGVQQLNKFMKLAHEHADQQLAALDS